MFKKTDKIILAAIGFFLGIFIITQFYSTKAVKKVSQPENNEIIALEVAKLSKTNADLRTEVKSLSTNLTSYKDSDQTAQEAIRQFNLDLQRYDIINSASIITGEGVVITIDNVLLTPQIVDMVNAIKNIGYQNIQINDIRISINTDLGQFSGLSSYQIIVLGDSSLIKSALERKGGIIDQIATNKSRFSITENENLELKAGQPLQLKYAKVVE